MNVLDRPPVPPASSEERIPVFVPYVGVDTLKHLTDALDVGWLGMGATTKEFEERIARYLGVQDRYVVATNTGTSAMHIALLAAGIGPGDEVITPSFNYVADHQAIRATGAEVVMCDVRDDDLGLDLASAESLITARTKAIVPLHFSGIPCAIEDVYALARKHGLRVIEDACHAFGSTVGGEKIGSGGDVQFFSFDPVKIITSIDGGCVVTPHREEYERLQHLRLLGVDKDTTLRYQNKRAWDYDVVSEGFRYHLTNIMASVGVSQIKRIDEFIASRRAVCERYSEAFSRIDGVRVLRRDYSDVSPFIYSLRVLGGRREALIEHLSARGVDVGIHFVPVHKHTYFAGARRSPMPVTERVVEEVVTLPLHSLMPERSIERVIEGVVSFFS
ncbi:MAG TPA: DegT/DnrJ/EryC1/StrS family aminotransferase [Candidatus Elarobacter sp.]|jgi:dTDP-4-amino-4,6-dideoxygalactose transaminase|nr:DegT/DnrJ/EryC1/StrS family aminotransferase [Candidatus Elarobacter sp.]